MYVASSLATYVASSLASSTLYCRCSRIKSMLWVGVALVTKLTMKVIHRRQVLNGRFAKVCMSWGARVTKTIFELGVNIANDIASALKLVWPHETKEEKV